MNNETEVFEPIQNLMNVNQLWNVRCLTFLNFCTGELIFDSTLTGRFRGPNEKIFRTSLPLNKPEIYRLDGQNLMNNETEVFEPIQNLMNVNQLWNVRRLIFLNFCKGKPWSITPKERRPRHPRLHPWENVQYETCPWLNWKSTGWTVKTWRVKKRKFSTQFRIWQTSANCEISDA